jgi:hypothetical protein
MNPHSFCQVLDSSLLYADMLSLPQPDPLINTPLVSSPPHFTPIQLNPYQGSGKAIESKTQVPDPSELGARRRWRKPQKNPKLESEMER